VTIGAIAVSFEYGENRSHRNSGDNASVGVGIITTHRPGQSPKRLDVGHDVAVDQGGEVWHADEGKRGFHIAAQHRSFMHFRPGLHLPFNPESIDIDQAGGVTPVPDPVELESPDAALAHMANKACLLKGFPGGNFMGSKAANGIALGNDPAPAASRGHQADVHTTTRVVIKWQSSNLVHCILPIQATQNPFGVDSSA